MLIYRTALSEREAAQLLAALRFWQSNGMCEPEERYELQGYGHFEEVPPMREDEVDNLCEKLNFSDYYSDENVEWRKWAEEMYGCEGDREICVDSDAEISLSDEGHAFVGLWGFVPGKEDEDD